MSLFEIFLAILQLAFFFIVVSGLGCCVLSRKHTCKGCKYYVKSSNQCTFNPIYGEPVPKQCQREDWEI